MQSNILGALNAPSLTRLLDHMQSGRSCAVRGIPEAQSGLFAALIAQRTGKQVLILQSNDLKAGRTYDDLLQIFGSQVHVLPSAEMDLTRGVSSHDLTWRRLTALNAVIRGECRILVSSADAVMQRMGDPDLYRSSILTLHPGDILPPREIVEKLVTLGYERVDMVEGRGQCALRGSILDVFPPAMSQALRIEFFDDEVDSIRTFDSISQRSLERLEEVELTPATEILITPEAAQEGAQRMRDALMELEQHQTPDASLLLNSLPPLPEDEADDEDMPSAPASRMPRQSVTETRRAELRHRLDSLRRDADTLELGLPFRRMRTWQTVICPRTWQLTDWFHADVVILCEPDGLRKRVQERQAGFAEDLRSSMERGEAVSAQQNLLLTWESILATLNMPRMVISDLTGALAGIEVRDAFDMGLTAFPGYSSHIRTLAADLKEWIAAGRAVCLLSGAVARGERLKAGLEEQGVSAVLSEDPETPLEQGKVLILPISLSRGFRWDEAGVCLVSDTDIYGATYHRSRSRRRNGEKISAFSELNVGDYVVHEDHGVGIYQGTVQMDNDGAIHEYLLIQYAGNDRLYVPVEQLQRIQKYIGNPSNPPRLNNIGGKDWSRAKGKVKESLRKMAFDLVQLYARRSQNTGHAFAPDTPWQQQFEDQFPFELTMDQAQSVQEIKADMESGRNMDRLLCGDVGYGKTEVSLRAAFKCIMDGKQAAILAPTTILAQQHYNTIVQRFAGFPVKIEVLSRFRTPKEQKRIIEDLQKGSIDFLVGTHRMLGKDVKFANLGLLIVDEEQRFGVAHKEIIKNMKSQVDVLTLSATPIPRTLHMSMVGIRDMSVLETPPEDRLPVQTHVVEYSDTLVRDAILREISRGGQVYFLYNRVQSIERFYERLNQLVPEARIGLAHGQMKEHGLEDVMMDFYGGSYDVLLCTTIIESGLDVPTANTLIVFDADRFGLSQLYQLRGRVGRSTRQAYAYFTVRPEKMLSETAEQRLTAIREFTEFGSGFRVAMRDLEIRGAGNILGPEQHGHLASVGYEMYCRLIEQAMQEARGQQDLSELETRVDLRVNAFLPENYIRDSHQRMEIYKRIAALSTESDRADIIDEMIDRFGEMPAEVNTLLDVALLRSICHDLGVSQVSHRGDVLNMRLDQQYVQDPMALIQAMKATDKRLSLSTAKPTAILLTVGRTTESRVLAEGIRVMDRVRELYLAALKPAESAESAPAPAAES